MIVQFGKQRPSEPRPQAQRPAETIAPGLTEKLQQLAVRSPNHVQSIEILVDHILWSLDHGGLDSRW